LATRGFETDGVDILMESRGVGIGPTTPVTNLFPLTNDDYGTRQFLYPSVGVISEPSTFVVLALGCLVLLGFRWRLPVLGVVGGPRPTVKCSCNAAVPSLLGGSNASEAYDAPSDAIPLGLCGDYCHMPCLVEGAKLKKSKRFAGTRGFESHTAHHP
jgi:hypothetical protein